MEVGEGEAFWGWVGAGGLPGVVQPSQAARGNVWGAWEEGGRFGSRPIRLLSAHWSLIFLRFQALEWGRVERPTPRRLEWHPNWEQLLRRGVFDPRASRKGVYAGVMIGSTLAPRLYGGQAPKPRIPVGPPPGPPPGPRAAPTADTTPTLPQHAVPHTPAMQFLTAWGQLQQLHSLTPLVCHLSLPLSCRNLGAL
jgi:hypothetical protein